MKPTFLIVTDCKLSSLLVFDHQGIAISRHWWLSFFLLKLLAYSIFRWWTWNHKTTIQKFSVIKEWESALIMPVWSVTICETPLIACPSPTFNIINDQTIKFSSFKRRSLQEASRRSPGGFQKSSGSHQVDIRKHFAYLLDSEHIYYLLQMLSYCKVVSESWG